MSFYHFIEWYKSIRPMNSNYLYNTLENITFKIWPRKQRKNERKPPTDRLFLSMNTRNKDNTINIFSFFNTINTNSKLTFQERLLQTKGKKVKERKEKNLTRKLAIISCLFTWVEAYCNIKLTQVNCSKWIWLTLHTSVWPAKFSKFQNFPRLFGLKFLVFSRFFFRSVLVKNASKKMWQGTHAKHETECKLHNIIVLQIETELNSDANQTCLSALLNH